MKISEIIDKLNLLKDEHGDIQVFCREDGYGGHAVHIIGEDINLKHLTLHDMFDDGDDVLIKELFPEWDGDYDTDQELSINYVEIELNNVIYST